MVALPPEEIARAGPIGLGMTNASPIVAPPGGKRRVIGTNPISLAVPDRAGGVAMFFDRSTTTMALARITIAKAAGARIPGAGRWMPRAGPQPMRKPRSGDRWSAGGHKGWGAGLLAAGMTGNRARVDIEALKAPQGGAAEVALELGAPMPRRNRCPADPAEVDEAARAQAMQLAGA